MNERIAITFPSNTGDVILALPMLDRLKASFPISRITAIASPQTKEFLSRNNYIDEVLIFNKRWSFGSQTRFAFSLRNKFDIFVDSKNTLLPFISGARKRSPVIRRFPKNIHVRHQYLALVKKIARQEEAVRSTFLISHGERNMLKGFNIPKALFISCSSRSRMKCYEPENLKKVIDRIRKMFPIVIIGEERDREYYGEILAMENVFDLVGRTKDMVEVAYLLTHYAQVLLGVDSSTIHLCSYLNIPVVALFGPTPPQRFGPYSDKSIVLQSSIMECIPCGSSGCSRDYQCMKINSEIVIDAVKKLLPNKTDT
ncbi:glycosyltransferase family 9 protein [Candidatus Omnitrophota bacterium]